MGLPVRRSRLVLQSSVTSKLGSVSLSGYVHHGRGTPLRTFYKYALVYLLEGAGRFQHGKLPLMPLRPGNLLFVYPEIPHSYGPGPGQKWTEFYIVFNGPVFDLWRRHGLLQPQQPLLHLPHLRRWLPQLEAAAGPDLPDTAAGMLQRICRLQDFLAQVLHHATPAAQPISWLDQATQLLVEKPQLSAPAIARTLGLSYETFRKEFARLTGQSPGRYRLHRLIEQARALITERNLSNKQIAETLGFYDEFHFSRRFHQVTAQTTRQFRQSL